MKLNSTLFIVAGMCILCTVGSAEESSIQGYNRGGFNRMFLDAHSPVQPLKYSRSEIQKMIRDAKTSEDFERLADHFDQQSLEFEHEADEQVKELERLLALPFHARSYPTQVESTRDLIKKYRTKADECTTQANTYRARGHELIHY